MQEPYQSLYIDADALINCLRDWEDAAAVTDPLASASLTLLALADPKREWTRGEALKALKTKMENISRDDLTGMELILACQAQVLNQVFMQSTQQYAKTRDLDREKNGHYAKMLTKTQNLCRMVIATLARVNNMKKEQKRKNELLSARPFMPLSNKELLGR